jgi:hypothetical protein
MASKLLSERAYAKHRGCARSSVQAARQAGRLTAKSWTIDDAGRVQIDPEIADREWAASTQADRVPISVRVRKASTQADLAPVVAKLAAVVAEAQRDTVAVASLRHAPAAVEGAAAALRAAGREATAAELERVLDLAAGSDGRALGLACELLDLAGEGAADDLELARRAGTLAALDAMEADHGDDAT